MNIPLNIDFLQILLHMLNFVILAGGLSLLLYNPIQNFLTERAAKLAEIEQKNKEAAEENEKMKAEYEEKMLSAKEEIAEMKKQAEQEWAATSAQYIDAAKEKADAIIRSAEEEAEERKDHILESAQSEIGELVVAATQKLLSETVTPEHNSALYDEFIRVAGENTAESRAQNDQK